jgi:hypothetical protein
VGGRANLLAILILAPLFAQTKSGCGLPQLQNQHQNAATIQHLEDEWTLAFLRGDTRYERCLLIPEFTEILASGDIKFLADELALAEKNRGKNLPMPELPKAHVLLHGNVAVAYGESTSKGPDGKPNTRFADSYLWQNGEWHVFFAQQTRIARH